MPSVFPHMAIILYCSQVVLHNFHYLQGDAKPHWTELEAGHSGQHDKARQHHPPNPPPPLWDTAEEGTEAAGWTGGCGRGGTAENKRFFFLKRKTCATFKPVIPS